MSMSFGQVNIWAVLVAAAATFVVGGLWYGVLFPKRWVAIHRFSDDEVEAMKKQQPRNFAIFIVGDLVMAVVISLLLINLEAATALKGAAVGFLLWLGIAATTGAAKNAAYNKPLAAYAIDTAHELICLVVMGLIIGGWR